MVASVGKAIARQGEVHIRPGGAEGASVEGIVKEGREGSQPARLGSKDGSQRQRRVRSC